MNETTRWPAGRSQPPPLVAGRSALRAGRIGLPWNVQADMFVTDTPRALDKAALDKAALDKAALDHLGVLLVDQVCALVGLPVQRVFATPPTPHGWVLCLDHSHGLTSTLAFGFGASILHRFRVSGSHGTLLVDATGPGIRVHTGDTVIHHWTDTGDQTTGDQNRDAETDLAAAQGVVDAAHRSASVGTPIPLALHQGATTSDQDGRP